MGAAGGELCLDVGTGLGCHGCGGKHSPTVVITILCLSFLVLGILFLIHRSRKLGSHSASDKHQCSQGHLFKTCCHSHCESTAKFSRSSCALKLKQPSWPHSLTLPPLQSCSTPYLHILITMALLGFAYLLCSNQLWGLRVVVTTIRNTFPTFFNKPGFSTAFSQSLCWPFSSWGQFTMQPAPGRRRSQVCNP